MEEQRVDGARGEMTRMATPTFRRADFLMTLAYATDLATGQSLCPEAVEAVLSCAGQPARRDATERLSGLTRREIEVLRLIAAGHTAKGAARELDIAPKTADNQYSKIGVSTKAAAALHAIERGLVQQGLFAA